MEIESIIADARHAHAYFRQRERELMAKRDVIDRELADVQSALRIIMQDPRLKGIDREEHGLPVENQRDLFSPSLALTERISNYFERSKKVAQPSEVDEVLRAYDPELRNNAVAEALSRMKRDGKLHRTKLEDGGSYYGLFTWALPGSEDDRGFRGQFVPDSLLLNHEPLFT